MERVKRTQQVLARIVDNHAWRNEHNDTDQDAAAQTAKVHQLTDIAAREQRNRVPN